MLILVDGDAKQAITAEALLVGVMAVLTPEQRKQCLDVALAMQAKLQAPILNVTRIVPGTPDGIITG